MPANQNLQQGELLAKQISTTTYRRGKQGTNLDSPSSNYTFIKTK